MEAKTTARVLLKNLLEEIQAGPFSVARVCVKAGMDPSQVSRWKVRDIEPRLSTIERLQEAHAQLKAEANRKAGRRELADL
jgi:hypothetical protein